MTRVLEVSSVSKSFPGVQALDNVSITFSAGSIHALLGENGAGKSTLIKIISGLQRPDSGEIRLNGSRAYFASLRQTASSGIAVVHQERNLIRRFSVGENIMLERLGKHGLSFINYNAIEVEAKHWLKLIELDVDPRTPISLLSVAQMQLVEIAKALSLQSRVLLLDEPTASLTRIESKALFDVLRKLRDEGVAIGFVSHKLEEVFEICDAVTVLRDGHNACDSEGLKDFGRQDIIKMMIGRTERFVSRAPRPKSDLAPYLALSEFGSIVGHRDINLAVSPGEILGLYGLVGAGRSELAKSIVGLMAQTTGEIRVNGNKVHISSPAKALHDFGIGYMSEDRKHEGLIQQHSVLMNLGITVWQRLANTFGFLRDKTVIKYTNPILQKIEFKTASIYESIGNLSGGNQQKISVAKWIAGDVKLLIIDEPTIGIDIKTKTYIHDLIHELAAGGTAILLITSEMSEMIEVADRVIVMSDFQIRGLVENDRNYQRTSQAIMNLIHRSEPTLARAEYITKQ